tara:strand:+ start:4466 stop:5230 length:765 start_codon:yes stop_codon:yes gene_type:complete
MKKYLSISFLFATLFIFSLNAQTNPNWEYWVTGKVKLKRGMSKEFEKAAAAKTEKFNKTPETAISTYKIMDGENQGKYERIQGYKDISWFNDNMKSNAGTQYWMNNVSQYIETYEGRKVWWRIKNLSYNWNPESSPKKHIHKLIRIIKPGKLGDFWRLSNRIVKVYEKNNYTGVQGVFKVVSGGNVNEIIFIDAFDDFTDQGKFPNTDKSLKELYNEMYNGSYDKDLEIYNEAIEMWGRQNERMSLKSELTTKL